MNGNANTTSSSSPSSSFNSFLQPRLKFQTTKNRKRNAEDARILPFTDDPEDQMTTRIMYLSSDANTKGRREVEHWNGVSNHIDRSNNNKFHTPTNRSNANSSGSGINSSHSNTADGENMHVLSLQNLTICSPKAMVPLKVLGNADTFLTEDTNDSKYSDSSPFVKQEDQNGVSSSTTSPSKFFMKSSSRKMSAFSPFKQNFSAHTTSDTMEGKETAFITELVDTDVSSLSDGFPSTSRLDDCSATECGIATKQRQDSRLHSKSLFASVPTKSSTAEFVGDATPLTSNRQSTLRNPKVVTNTDVSGSKILENQQPPEQRSLLMGKSLMCDFDCELGFNGFEAPYHVAAATKAVAEIAFADDSEEDEFFLSMPKQLETNRFQESNGWNAKILKREHLTNQCHDKQRNYLSLEAQDYAGPLKSQSSFASRNVATFGRSASVTSTMTFNSCNSLNEVGSSSFLDFEMLEQSKR